MTQLRHNITQPQPFFYKKEATFGFWQMACVVSRYFSCCGGRKVFCWECTVLYVGRAGLCIQYSHHQVRAHVVNTPTSCSVFNSQGSHCLFNAWTGMFCSRAWFARILCIGLGLTQCSKQSYSCGFNSVYKTLCTVRGGCRPVFNGWGGGGVLNAWAE